ncbi:HipA domain-containing protein [Brevibacterium yomogidense]|uniref:HipA domain-containing protein n=1 Tax=Brevibacterium yomogidense TaxID=946573 RepID=UPI0018DF95F6|nr:HipA domain-containing protein [Brevibacterium yomogidense]
MTASLDVRLTGTVIGEFLPDSSFRWAEGWEQLSPLNSAVLSHSLPFGADRPDPGPFFGGLLPEGIGLQELAREARVASDDLHGLLAEVGADVGGAVTIGEPRPPLDPLVLDEPDLSGVLERARGYLRASAVGGGGSSATGVRPKVALTWDSATEKWMVGRGSYPSTHLLKPVPREEAAGVRAEAYLNAIARAIGLSGHSASVEGAGEHVVLVVERYDRVVPDDGPAVRVHQEDAAQALGLPWGGNAKYEQVESRASLRNVASLLSVHGSVFAPGSDDREGLLQMTTLNIVAGNTDAHAKNFSLLLPQIGVPTSQPEGTVRLADAYDIVPQSFFTAEPDPLAMRVNGKAAAGAVTAGDLIAEASAWGLSRSRAAEVVTNTLRAIERTVGDGIGEDGTGGYGPPPGLQDFLTEQATNLLRGDQAWTRALPAGLAYAKRGE